MEQFNEKQEFEVHVTIKSTNNIEPFMKICNTFVDHVCDLNSRSEYNFLANARVFTCKPIIIELPAGINQQQPMCSIFLSSTLSEAVKCGELFMKYCKEFHSEYIPCRNKVEARFKNIKDGTIDLDLMNNNAMYWEFHIKILFEITDLVLINEFRVNLEKKFPSARLSKSALSSIGGVQSDNTIVGTSRVVTLRLYNGDKDNAQKELDKLVEYLSEPVNQSKFSFKTRNHIEKELSVYDTNVFHDAGWIGMKV